MGNPGEETAISVSYYHVLNWIKCFRVYVSFNFILVRPDYVMTHYVHYATVTEGILQTKDEASVDGKSWTPSFRESSKEDRVTDEINQAVMLHSKTTVPEYTTDWKKRCKLGAKNSEGENCRVGFPWPGNTNTIGSKKENEEGFAHNCFTNEKLNSVWIPKLRTSMKNREVRVASLPADAFKKKKKVKPKDPNKFCGHCIWEKAFQCNERVSYLMEKKGKSEAEAKESLLAEGHCKP